MMLKEGLLYERSPGNAVRCNVCQRRCRIKDGDSGYCRTRVNNNGTLYSTIYGEVSTWRRAPIEIKPVYHYLPGSYAFSLGSLGCNFLCDGCQNYDISFALAENVPVQTRYLSPDESVKLSQNYKCQGISWTYNEPTLWFEYTLDGARLAKSLGLYTNYVTNGYMTEEALEMIGPYLDVFRVDIKAFESQAYKKIAHISDWKHILENTIRAKKRWNMHVEVVTNIIQGINDDPGHMREMAQWVKGELGPCTPWHFTRFFPHWKLTHVKPTPVESLEKIRETALKEGLTFVYIGNVPGHPANNTYCPSCGETVIERNDWGAVKCSITSNACPFCKSFIFGKFNENTL
jgi:pyruvate formate lyase activating enzyme